MLIAIDIDSTLHPYWDQLSAVAHRRFGITLPYEEQVSWTIDLLRPEQLRACVAETHAEAAVLAAEPYPGAADVVSRWRAQGHRILIVSHRRPGAYEVTRRWLSQIGLAHDELHCLEDKVAHCRSLGVGLLIDDSPPNLLAALEAGIAVATLAHPWNRDICEDEDVLCASDWPALECGLTPLLGASGGARQRAGGEGEVSERQKKP